MHCTEAAEPVRMPFGLWTRVGPRNRVLGVGPIYPMGVDNYGADHQLTNSTKHMWTSSEHIYAVIGHLAPAFIQPIGDVVSCNHRCNHIVPSVL